MNSWIDCKLGDFLTLQRGVDLPEADREGGDVPVVASRGIVGYHNVAKATGPGVVIGRSGSLGGGQYITNDFWPLNTTLWVKDFKGNNPRFCYYLLRSLDFSGYNVGSGVPTLNRNHVHPLPVKVPPRCEQDKIAQLLGDLDDKIDVNHRMNETLEAIGRAIFKDWFVDFGPVRAKMEGREPYLSRDIWDLFPARLDDEGKPEGWKQKVLGEVTYKPEYGYTASAKEEDTGTKFLRITDINKRDWIDWSRVPFCDIENNRLNKYFLQHGDIVIARMADPGHGALIEHPPQAVFASYLIRFRPKEAYAERYLQYWLRSVSFWNTVRAWQSGTTRYNLNARNLAAVPLIWPSENLRRAFEALVEPLREKVTCSVKENGKLSEVRDLILPKLVSGEIGVGNVKRTVEEAL
jgi:type I restriction enzyme S subunit